jgi:hypothetical protein
MNDVLGIPQTPLCRSDLARDAGSVSKGEAARLGFLAPNCRRQFRQGQRLTEIPTENKEVNSSEIWHSHCISSMA